MAIVFLVLFFFDFAFLNFTAICFVATIIKMNRLQNEITGGIKDVDISSFESK